MKTIDCGFELDDKTAYLFSGNQYIRMTLATGMLDAGYPKPIAGNWPGLWPSGIDAAVNWGDGKVYFFRGDAYMRYDLAADRVDADYPQPIEGNWPGLWSSEIDAAVNWGNGKVYFFRGDSYLRYDIATDRVDPDYPRPILGNWPGLWTSGIGAAVRVGRDKVLFFRGGEVTRYDVGKDAADAGYPRPAFGPSAPAPQPTVGSSEAARAQAVELALGEIGKVIAQRAGPPDETGQATRVGWEHLMQYFEVACGGPNRFNRDVVKYHRFGCGKEGLQSWCGIFVVWALKSAGIAMGNWQFGSGVSAIMRQTQSPGPGDVGYIHAPFQHHCLVVRIEGDTILTVDGNTLGVGAVAEQRRRRSEFTSFYRI